MGSFLPRLYAVLDPAQIGGRSAREVCESLLAAGVKLIQYRHKAAASRELYENSVLLGALVTKADGTFVVNDRADVALAAGAGGVHVGQDDLPVEWARKVIGAGKLVGFSTHNLDQVVIAGQTSADYIAFGPVFPTTSKEKPGPLVGLEGLRRARQATHKPLVAIGGITLDNVRGVVDAGADSVAVISGLLKSSDIGARARAFLKALGES